MTSLPSTLRLDRAERRRPACVGWLAAALPILVCALTGCATGGFTPPWRSADTTKEPANTDGVVLTGAYHTAWSVDPEAQKELNAAKAVFEQKKYAEAEPLFHKIVLDAAPKSFLSHLDVFNLLGTDSPNSSDTKDKDDEHAKAKKKKKGRRRGTNPIAEEALFHEAECQRLQKNYRDAELNYTKLLAEYPRSQFITRTCQGLFEIADHWLEPTRQEMDQRMEVLDGKRWFVTPTSYFHWDKDMPFLDTQGRAILTLDAIRLHDLRGSLGEKALLYLGTIHFHREDYKEADFYFDQLYKEYPNSPHAAKALKQAVICKQLMTGGAVYDCRGVEESKKLLMKGMGAYPELARDEAWVRNQLMSINVQMAERDLKIAEYYERTGHFGPAYFYYELVCRRYPNTSYCDKAGKRKDALKSRVEKEQQKAAPPQPQQPSPAAQDGTPPAQPSRTVPRFLPSLSPPARP